jgi:hypothetical protein
VQITPGTFVALSPELLTFVFSMLVLMIGIFNPRSFALTAGLAAFGSLGVLRRFGRGTLGRPDW